MKKRKVRLPEALPGARVRNEEAGLLFSTPCSFFFLFVLWVLSFLSRTTVLAKLMFWQGFSSQNKSNSFFLYVSTAFFTELPLPVLTPQCLTGKSSYPPCCPFPRLPLHPGRVRFYPPLLRPWYRASRSSSVVCFVPPKVEVANTFFQGSSSIMEKC